jgi:PAS domain S-box-containing protein
MKTVKGKSGKEKLTKENDITVSRKAEKTLQKSGIKLRSILDATPFPIALVDVQDNNIEFWSRSALALFGHTAATTQEWYEIAYPDPEYRKEVIDRWKPFLEIARLSDHAVNTGVYQIACHDGSFRICELYATFQAGKLIVTFNDITERKSVEQALRESEERFSKAYRTSPISFMIANMEDGRIIEVNEAFTTISGFTREEALSSTTLDLNIWVHEEDRLKMIAALQSGRNLVRQETMLRSKDGSFMTVLLSAQMIQLNRKNCIISSVEDITERKRAEEELRKSEDKFKYVFDNSLIGKSITFPTGEIHVNRAFCDMTGYTPEELENKRWQDITHPDDIELTQQSVDSLISGKKDSTHFVKRFIRKDDNVIWVDLSTSLRRDADNMPLYFISSLIDITDRIQSEVALQESEQKYRSIFENVQDVYYETTIDGVIVDVSPSISIISKGQYTREELVGQSMYGLYVDPEERALMINELKKNTSVVDFEINLRNKDGSVIYCSVSSKLQFDSEGRPEKLIGSMRDVTQRKMTEEALNRSQKEFQNYFESGAVGMSVTNTDRKWIQVNQKLCSILGYSREELIGKEWNELTHPEDLKVNIEMFQMALNGKINNYELDKRFLRKDGSVVFVTVSVVCERNSDGTVHHLLSSYIDITERKRFEEELVKAKEKAEESDRLKTAFLHNVSHEIRTPMNAIMGFTALLSETDSDAATRKSYIDVISQSSDHLLAIISDIIDFSSIEADLVKVIREEFNLNDVFKAVYSYQAQKAKEKKIDLAFETGLTDSEANIVTDKTKLIRILSNILSNAIKFTHQGRIRYSYRLKLAMLEFTVSDTGIGIPQEQQSKIFERFYQVHNQASRTYEGTGLGLAISKAYVELLGGSIRVISAPGAGSKFVFTIPYEKKGEKPNTFSQVPDTDKFYFKVRKKILVAEDVESNFRLIKYFLTGLNAEVIHVTNGKEAVDCCLSDKSIDLVLMDIKMPVMDGYTATKILRDNNISIPIIAQTAYADDKEQALKAGCTGFISKPFDRYGLLRAINELI